MYHEDPEDILSDSLQTLYSYEPITLVSAGAIFSYTPPNGQPITIQTPDTQPANWALHASSIWASSRFMADNLHHLNLPSSPARLLELGAGAGLPGISIAQTNPHIEVIVSDYPDEQLIATLFENVTINNIHSNARAVPYAWGTDVAQLGGPFDIVIAADTLWNRDFHSSFIETIALTLKKSVSSEVHLVAGLHTGRYTLEAFFKLVVASGFTLESAIEMQVSGTGRREWSIERASGENEKERRRWVVWVVIKWADIVP